MPRSRGITGLITQNPGILSEGAPGERPLGETKWALSWRPGAPWGGSARSGGWLGPIGGVAQPDLAGGWPAGRRLSHPPDRAQTRLTAHRFLSLVTVLYLLERTDLSCMQGPAPAVGHAPAPAPATA